MTTQIILDTIRFAFTNMSSKAFYKWQALYINKLKELCVHPDIIIQALDLIVELQCVYLFYLSIRTMKVKTIKTVHELHTVDLHFPQSVKISLGSQFVYRIMNSNGEPLFIAPVVFTKLCHALEFVDQLN